MKGLRSAMLVVLALWMIASPWSAHAQTYPTKPIRMLLGFAPGGPLDTFSRILAQDMSTYLGQPVVVENRAGASGQIATDAVARAAPDGYTILSTASTFIVNPILMQKVASDPLKDFVPIAHTAVLPTILIVPADSKANTVNDLVEMAKAAPGAISYASAGNGGPAHLAGALLASTTGTEMTHIPFKGAAPALAEIIAGRVSYSFYTMSGLREQVAQKRVKALAITAAKRDPEFPNVPTMTEAGYPGFDAVGAWFGIVAPAGTPPAIVQELNMAIEKSLAKSETRERLKVVGATPVGGPPANFKAFLEADQGRWSRLIQQTGIKAAE